MESQLSDPFNIFICAADASSECHGAEILKVLKQSGEGSGNTARFGAASGVGGPKMRGQGLVPLMAAEEFMVGGGPLEVLSRLPKRWALERKVESLLQSSALRPDVALLIDNGELNLRLAALFHFFKVPVVYYIPPKVWAWREQRMEQLGAHCDMVLGILPFEKELYDSWGVPFRYVGNPLLDEVSVEMDRFQSLRELRLPDHEYLLLMPGSRYSEIRHHVELFSQTVIRFKKKWQETQSSEAPPPKWILAVPEALAHAGVEESFRRVLGPEGQNLHCVLGQSHQAMKASRLGLIKSGTSTLEAALLGLPMVVTYQSGALARWMFRHVVRYTGPVSLVNLVVGGGPRSQQRPFPELILESAEPEALSATLFRYWQDSPERRSMEAVLSQVHGLLRPEAGMPQSPSAAVASVLKEIALRGRGAKV